MTISINKTLLSFFSIKKQHNIAYIVLNGSKQI